MDLSKLSDDELQQLYEQGKTAPATAASEPPKPPSVVRLPPAAKPDLTKMSDAELRALYDRGSQTQPDQYGVHDVGQTVSSDRPPAPPKEDAPSIASMDTTKALGFSQGTPLEALKDLLHGKRWDEVLKAFSPATIFAAIAPLSTGDPRQRQLIIQKQIPGAKAVDDKYGNPMIELDGKRYDVSGSDVDIARAGLQTAGGMAVGAAIPTLPLWGTALASGGLMAGQSAAEDVVARAAGGTNRPWVDPVKAGVAGVTGAVAPYAVGKVVMPIAGEISALGRSGTPLGDDAIRALGLDPARMTPEIRQAVSNVARRTFGDPVATQAAYRQAVAGKFGVDLTKGEISQLSGQMAKEKNLSGPGDDAAERVMQEFRTGPQLQAGVAGQGGQNAQITQAQNVLRTQAGGGTTFTPAEATTVLQSGYKAADAQAKAGVDAAYGQARDPAAVIQKGGLPNAPAQHVGQLDQAVQASLAQSGPGRTLLAGEGEGMTFAQQAMALVNKWTKGAAGQPSGLLGPTGQPLSRPAQPSSWNDIIDRRQALSGLQEQAAKSGNAQDAAAVTAILKGFDDHFGPLNPLMVPARAAHEERMSTFFAGGSADQDKATKAALTALQSPESGPAVTKAIFNNVKTGDALAMIDHLQTKVFPNQPAAQAAIQEQAISRLTVAPDTGVTLTPRQQVTNIDAALEGDAQKPLYEKLFSGNPEILAELRQYRDLQQAIASGRESPNPSKSGLLLSGIIKHITDKGLGAGLGYLAGLPLGVPELGALGGGAIGTGVSKYIPRIQAQSAINPGANYLPRGPNTSAVPGLLGNTVTPQATNQEMGPADRIRQSLLTPGGLFP